MTFFLHGVLGMAFMIQRSWLSVYYDGVMGIVHDDFFVILSFGIYPYHCSITTRGRFVLSNFRVSWLWKHLPTYSNW